MHAVRDFGRHEAGTIAVVAAITIMLVCAAAGGAVDFGRAYAARSRLAAASDAAALAGAAAPAELRTAAATSYFKTIYTGNVVPVVSVTGTAVQVVATQQVKTTFLNVIGMTELIVAADSEAAIGAPSGAPLCILLLEPSQIGLSANSDSKLDASCGIHINSSNSEALFANSDSHVTATDISVNGQVRLNSGSTATSYGRKLVTAGIGKAAYRGVA